MRTAIATAILLLFCAVTIAMTAPTSKYAVAAVDADRTRIECTGCEAEPVTGSGFVNGVTWVCVNPTRYTVNAEMWAENGQCGYFSQAAPCWMLIKCTFAGEIQITDNDGGQFHAFITGEEACVNSVPGNGNSSINSSTDPYYVDCNGGLTQFTIDVQTGHDCQEGNYIAEIEFAGECQVCDF